VKKQVVVTHSVANSVEVIKVSGQQPLQGQGFGFPVVLEVIGEPNT
jgi:hypothetical protein